MADRFNDSGINGAITGSGLVGASSAEVEMQESDGSVFNSTGNAQFSLNTNAFNNNASATPPDNTTLGTKTASGGTEFDKLQYRIDYGSGLIRLFRIDNIGETGIVTGEDVTVETGSLDCGTTGLANVIRDGLSSVSIDIDVKDSGGTVQASFTGVSYSYLTSNDEFTLDNTQSFKNNTGSSFTLSTIEVFADSDLFFSVSRNDNVPDGAEVDITGLSNTITNLS
jgi:hypothetical protein